MLYNTVEGGIVMNNNIGEFIKEQRISKELTQKELADKIGVTDKAISRWETGRGMPDVTLLVSLADELDVSVNELLIGEKIKEENKIEKYEETIVNTLKDNKNQVIKLHKIIYLLFVAIEAVAIYGITLNATPSDAMGLLLGLVFIVTPVVSFLFGLTNIDFKFKALYPWLVLILFFPSNFLYWETEQAFEIGIMYGLGHLIISYVSVLVATGLVTLVKYLVNHIVTKSKDKDKH